jgi:hypothetical protein
MMEDVQAFADALLEEMLHLYREGDQEGPGPHRTKAEWAEFVSGMICGYGNALMMFRQWAGMQDYVPSFTEADA